MWLPLVMAATGLSMLLKPYNMSIWQVIGYSLVLAAIMVAFEEVKLAARSDK